MIKCLNCEKEFEPKRETAKFCSTSCRVLWHRKNGNSKPVSRVQVQVLYNLALSALEEIKKDSGVNLPSGFQKVTKIGILDNEGGIQPLKSFEQWQAAKRECETEEDWEVIKAGIKAAPNLSSKQKDLLIKYS